MVRLQDKFKDRNFHVMMVTNTVGSWGVQSVVPGPEEVAHLKDYYLNRHKIKYPIAIWEGQKKPTEDGGMLPEKNVNYTNYSVYRTPFMCLVDAQGKIRQVIVGFTRDHEERIATKVRLLVEAQEKQNKTE